jgi:hypothetical protein
MTFKKGCFPWGDDYYYLEGGAYPKWLLFEGPWIEVPTNQKVQTLALLGNPRPPTRIATPDGVGFVQK